MISLANETSLHSWGMFLILLTCSPIASSVVVAQEVKSLSDLTDLNRAPSTKLALILLEPSVQKKLSVSGDAYKKLVEVLREQMKLLPSIASITEEKLEKRLSLYTPFVTEAERNDKYIWELLSELLAPAEMDQLMGIHIGVNGMEAILNRNIAARLQISDDQNKKISEAIESVRKAKRHVLTDLASGRKPADLELLLTDRSSTTSAVLKLLDKRQQDTIDSMLQGFKVSSVNSISLGW